MFVIPFLGGLTMGWLTCRLSDWLPTLTQSEGTLVSASFYRDRSKLITSTVMLITVVLYTHLWNLLQFSANFFFLTSLCTFFILVAVIDLKYQLILNILILPAIALLLIYQFLPPSPSSWQALLGGILTFLLFLLVAVLTHGGLGGGDIKLAAFLGVTFGLPYVLWALLAGALTGGLTAAYFLLVKRWQVKAEIPYGPFLCLGAIIALLINPLPWLFSLFS